jgi:hypothetical protein
VLLCVHSFQSWVNFQWIFHLHLILFGTNYDVISSVLLLLNPTYTKILPSISQSRAHALKRGSHAQRYTHTHTHTHTLFSWATFIHTPLWTVCSQKLLNTLFSLVSNISQTTKLFNKHLL